MLTHERKYAFGHLGALDNLAVLALHRGDLAGALQKSEEALRLSKSLKTELVYQASSRARLGYLHMLSGDYECAHRMYEDASDLYQKLNMRQEQAAAKLAQCTARLYSHSLQELIHSAALQAELQGLWQQAEELGYRRVNEAYIHSNCYVAGQVLAFAGQFEQALAALNREYEMVQYLGPLANTTEFHLGMGWLYSLQEEYALAIPHFQAALDQARSRSLLHSECLAAEGLAQAYGALEDHTQEQGFFKVATDLRRRHQMPVPPLFRQAGQLGVGVDPLQWTGS